MGRNLYRGKIKNSNSWVYGYYVMSLDCKKHFIIQEMLDPDIATCSDCGNPDITYFEVEANTVGQCIEIKGKKVFEGDIFVHCFDDKVFGVVKYGEYRNICDDVHGGHVGFYVDWENAKHKGITRVDLAYWIKVSEIVGNIWENPKLIEKEREDVWTK